MNRESTILLSTDLFGASNGNGYYADNVVVIVIVVIVVTIEQYKTVV